MNSFSVEIGSDVATGYYRKDVLKYKGDSLRKNDGTREKFEEDMADSLTSSKNEADKQASLDVIRKAYLSNQGGNFIEDDDAYKNGQKESMGLAVWL